ncbi:TIGR01777 family protein [Bacillus obstructivus]|nr:TIGR01777 family protein [Bacillus sp. Gen3]OJH16716.1 TIGR01777 family protein [Bacillus obstructivus]
MHIVIAGGSGFIGGKIQKFLLGKGHQVTILTRNPNKTIQTRGISAVEWLQKDSRPEKELREVDAIINLAGESINGLRWTNKKKKEIVHSRMTATNEIVRMMNELHPKPQVLINASAIGYYGMSTTQEFTEVNNDEAPDFLATVVRKWENAAAKARNTGTRVVFARFGLVLGNGGALPLMLLPYKMKIGGTIGTGEQWVSWIHVEDVVRMLYFAILHKEIEGPLNVTAPNPVTMRQFGKAISSVMHSPHWLPVPSWALKLGLGEMSSMLLEGQKVIPEKALRYDFNFHFPQLERALEEIVYT